MKILFINILVCYYREENGGLKNGREILGASDPQGSLWNIEQEIQIITEGINSFISTKFKFAYKNWNLISWQINWLIYYSTSLLCLLNFGA